VGNFSSSGNGFPYRVGVHNSGKFANSDKDWPIIWSTCLLLQFVVPFYNKRLCRDVELSTLRLNNCSKSEQRVRVVATGDRENFYLGIFRDATGSSGKSR